MPNIRDRIVMEVGSFPSTMTSPELDQVITDSLGEIVSELPDSALFSIAEAVADSGSGVDVADRRVLRAHKANITAGKVDYIVATDTQRTFYANQPIWYELGGTAYIKPEGGSFLLTKELAAGHLDTSVTGANNFFTQLLIAKASINVTRMKMIRARESFSDAITLPTAPAVPTAPAFTYTDATPTTLATVTIGSLGTAPTYTPPALTPSYTDFDTYFDLEDAEVGAMAIEKLQQQVREFQAELQDALTVTNTANIEYQANLQKVIQQAQIDLERLRDDAQRSDNLDLANEARELERQVSQYAQSLQRFSQELALYNAQVNAESTRFAQSLQLGTNEIRSLSFDAQRLQALYRDRYMQYCKSYSQMPPIRVVQYDF